MANSENSESFSDPTLAALDMELAATFREIDAERDAESPVWAVRRKYANDMEAASLLSRFEVDRNRALRGGLSSADASEAAAEMLMNDLINPPYTSFDRRTYIKGRALVLEFKDAYAREAELVPEQLEQPSGQLFVEEILASEPQSMTARSLEELEEQVRDQTTDETKIAESQAKLKMIDAFERARQGCRNIGVKPASQLALDNLNRLVDTPTNHFPGLTKDEQRLFVLDICQAMDTELREAGEF